MTSKASVSAKDLFARSTSSSFRPIPTFVQSLDLLLDGGIQPGLVTEIVGDSGLGKTTLCLQLCMDVQIPRVLQGPESHALFIDTENSFVVNRARGMAKAFASQCNSVMMGKGKMSAHKVMSGIHVVKCKDYAQFEKIILSLDDFISRNRKIRLIVIDSLAFPFYAQPESFWSRSKPLYSIGQVLHYLAKRYGIAVVLTNKLTTRFDNNGGEEYYVPFLGETWNFVPNQRLQLYWGTDGKVRIAELVKSSKVSLGKVLYKVFAVGIRE